jgi:hypothetical protein
MALAASVATQGRCARTGLWTEELQTNCRQQTDGSVGGAAARRLQTGFNGDHGPSPNGRIGRQGSCPPIANGFYGDRDRQQTDESAGRATDGRLQTGSNGEHGPWPNGQKPAKLGAPNVLRETLALPNLGKREDRPSTNGRERWIARLPKANGLEEQLKVIPQIGVHFIHQAVGHRMPLGRKEKRGRNSNDHA